MQNEKKGAPDSASSPDTGRCRPSVLHSALCTLHSAFRNRFVRFLVVGAVNTAFGYGIFALFILMGMHYALAALLGQVCGVLFNFKTVGTFVFRSHNNVLVFRFFAVYAVTYGLNVAFLKLFALCGVGPLIAGAILLFPMALLAYTLNKVFVFRAK